MPVGMEFPWKEVILLAMAQSFIIITAVWKVSLVISKSLDLIPGIVKDIEAEKEHNFRQDIALARLENWNGMRKPDYIS